MNWITLKNPIELKANKEINGPEIVPFYVLAVGIENGEAKFFLGVDEACIRVIKNDEELRGWFPIINDIQHL